MRRFGIIFAILALTAGCASSPPTPGPGPTQDLKPAVSTPVTAPKHAAAAKLDSQSSSFIQDDLAAAAALATANGYPARAGVYNAMAATGAAVKAQAAACKAAIDASLGNLPQTGQAVGAFTAFEMAAEAVGAGVPAAVKINCEPIPLISGPGLLPKLF